MSRYAIDVVILPPEPVMDLAITWNKQLSGLREQSILLNGTNTMPHISLLMGCMTADVLPEARAILAQVAHTRPPMFLNITGLQFDGDSHPVAALDIFLSRELAEFQRDLIDVFRPLITQDAREQDLVDPPISPSALEWINRFIPEQCDEGFWPHITLGHGRPVEKQMPLTFKATRIAICHLGNHCTCTNILAEATLIG
ncbi:MAG TPA: 2'-5' RNA ligase family protein [Chryseolinea sp.]|nr:2'-5' RNA ligase family protein [Chryseolinea sp.]